MPLASVIRGAWCLTALCRATAGGTWCVCPVFQQAGGGYQPFHISAATAMTEVRENHYVLRKNSHGTVCADLGALAAVGALFLVYPGDREVNCFVSCNDRFQEDVVVGFLYITVKQLHLACVFKRKGKTGSHQSLTSPSFATGNRYNHPILLPSWCRTWGSLGYNRVFPACGAPSHRSRDRRSAPRGQPGVDYPSAGHLSELVRWAVRCHLL